MQHEQLTMVLGPRATGRTTMGKSFVKDDWDKYYVVVDLPDEYKEAKKVYSLDDELPEFDFKERGLYIDVSHFDTKLQSEMNQIVYKCLQNDQPVIVVSSNYRPNPRQPYDVGVPCNWQRLVSIHMIWSGPVVKPEVTHFGKPFLNKLSREHDRYSFLRYSNTRGSTHDVVQA